MNFNPIDQSAILMGGQQLVPNWAQEELRRRVAESMMATRAVQRKAAEQEIAQQAASREELDGFRRDIADAWLSGDASRVGGVMAAYPKFSESIRKAWETKTDAVRSADLRQMSEIFFAGQAGNFERAGDLLRKRIEADRAAKKDTADDEQMLAELTSGDPIKQRSAMGMISGILSSVVPDRFAATVGALNEGMQDFTLVPGAKRYAADGTLIASAPFAPRPISVGEGETIVEYNPNAEGGGPSSSGGGAATALRTNPGAIKDGAWARSQPGYSGSSGGFATFSTPEQGRAAQTRLLRDQYLGQGFDTPAKIVEKYAPRGPENSDASVSNYIGYVSRSLGIGPNDRVSPGQLPRLAQAMREFETGQRPNGAPRVVAQGAPKPPPAPSATRAVGGKVYVKVNGRWYMQGAR